jgi:hypothetical protein
VEPVKREDGRNLFAIDLAQEVVHKIDLNNDQGPYYTGVMNKIKREEFKIDKLIDRREKELNWDFTNDNVTTYRRSMIPLYLLHLEASSFPIYLSQTTLKYDT